MVLSRRNFAGFDNTRGETRVFNPEQSCCCANRFDTGFLWRLAWRAIAINQGYRFQVAVRNTSFHHLRDAYIRALNARLGVQRKENQNSLTAEQEDVRYICTIRYLRPSDSPNALLGCLIDHPRLSSSAQGFLPPVLSRQKSSFLHGSFGTVRLVRNTFTVDTDAQRQD